MSAFVNLSSTDCMKNPSKHKQCNLMTNNDTRKGKKAMKSRSRKMPPWQSIPWNGNRFYIICCSAEYFPAGSVLLNNNAKVTLEVRQHSFIASSINALSTTCWLRTGSRPFACFMVSTADTMKSSHPHSRQTCKTRSKAKPFISLRTNFHHDFSLAVTSILLERQHSVLVRIRQSGKTYAYGWDLKL